MTKIDRNGITIDDLNEILDYLKTEFKKIYGDNINLDQDTPDGQLISILAKVNADIQERLIDVYNSFDIDAAVGTQLDRIVKLAGIKRYQPTKSKVEMQITCNKPVVIDENYEAVDIYGQVWIPTQTYYLQTGINNGIIFESKEYGSYKADANTITKQGTIYLEIDSLTNPYPATAGRDEETDEELRKRFKKSVENPAKATRGSILSAILQVENVEDAIVYENDTDTTDNLGIPPHSIWCIIEGGVESDIAKAIISEKSAGVGMKGDIQISFQENVPRPDGDDLIITYTAKFDRPTYTNLYIQLNVHSDNGVVDEQAIKNAIAQKTFKIGENLITTELYKYAYQAGDYVITNLQASKDGINYTDGEIIANPDEKFIIDTANIEIMVI